MPNAPRLFKERGMPGTNKDPILGKPLSWVDNWGHAYPTDAVFMVGVESQLVRGYTSEQLGIVKMGIQLAPRIPGMTMAEEAVVPVRFSTVCSIFGAVKMARSRTARMAD